MYGCLSQPHMAVINSLTWLYITAIHGCDSATWLWYTATHGLDTLWYMCITATYGCNTATQCCDTQPYMAVYHSNTWLSYNYSHTAIGGYHTATHVWLPIMVIHVSQPYMYHSHTCMCITATQPFMYVSVATRVCFNGPGSVNGPFWPNGSVLGPFFFKKVPFLAKIRIKRRCYGLAWRKL